jgi:hypothetical protein
MAAVPKPERGWYDQLRYLFASEGFSIDDSIIERTLKIQTQQQMVLAAIGIQRYRLRTGKLPENLSALVPEYLPAVPRDFMDGKDLKYRLLPGGKEFVLYSVGEDGKDDGGDPTQQKEKKLHRDFWDGRDAVWPSPASQEEAQAVMAAE